MRNNIQRRLRSACGVALAAFLLAPATAAAAPPPPPADETGPIRPNVVGGRDATEPYSFVASLQLPVTGGVAAQLHRLADHPRWVITAAHCVPDRIIPGTAKVRVGSVDRTAGGTLAGVSRVAVHPRFDPTKPGYDLALVELDQSVPYRPVLLASRAGEVGSPNRVMGWGVICDADLINDPVCRQAPKVLQELDTKRLPDERCSFCASVTRTNPIWSASLLNDGDGDAKQRTGPCDQRRS